MRYELLTKGTTQIGDKVYGQHYLSGPAGTEINEGYVIFRPLPDKPKVELQALSSLIAFKLGRGGSYDEVAKDVLKFLNIELEEPKPDWKVEFENWYMGKYRTMGEGFKQVGKEAWFEAGQKSKEGK